MCCYFTNIMKSFFPYVWLHGAILSHCHGCLLWSCTLAVVLWMALVMTLSGSSLGVVQVYIFVISHDGGFLIQENCQGAGWDMPVDLGALQWIVSVHTVVDFCRQWFLWSA